MYNLLDAAVSPDSIILTLLGEFIYYFCAIGFILIITVIFVFLAINKKRKNKAKKDEYLNNKEEKDV